MWYWGWKLLLSLSYHLRGIIYDHCSQFITTIHFPLSWICSYMFNHFFPSFIQCHIVILIFSSVFFLLWSWSWFNFSFFPLGLLFKVRILWLFSFVASGFRLLFWILVIPISFSQSWVFSHLGFHMCFRRDLMKNCDVLMKIILAFPLVMPVLASWRSQFLLSEVSQSPKQKFIMFLDDKRVLSPRFLRKSSKWELIWIFLLDWCLGIQFSMIFLVVDFQICFLISSVYLYDSRWSNVSFSF